jgi:hypothetical protein
VSGVGIVALLLPALALVLALGWLAVRFSAQVARIDLQRLYLYIVSFLALMLAAIALLVAVQDATRIVLGADPAGGTAPVGLQRGQLDQPWDLPLRDSLAGELGPFVVAAPVWLWFYRRATRRSDARKEWTIHRFYLYAVAAVFLVTAIGFVAAMAAQALRVLLGLVDLNGQLAVREVWQGVARGFLDGGICAVLWWSHYRAIPPSSVVRQLPAA